ncbi:MAG: DUF3857 domain-containing protein, partial [Planctomycetota bacterium]
LAALATYYSGIVSFQVGGNVLKSRSEWSELGFLESWRVIGAFDNERGGGFTTRYGPEEDLAQDKTHDGKKRDVAWRSLPVQPVAGKVDFDALFRPNDECLAYALTFVEAESPIAAELRLGTGDGYRAWVNGTLVASEDVQRDRSFDQSVVPISLAKGWNTVLVKVAESDGRWELQARLSAAGGGRIRGAKEGQPDGPALASALERFRSVRGEAPSAANEKAPEPKTPATIANLQAFLKKNPNVDRAHYLLGAVLRERGAHDRNVHPDVEALRRAVNLRSNSAAYSYELALALNRTSTIAAERDDNDRRDALERAAEAGCALAKYDLAVYYIDTFSNFRRAAAWIESALDQSPGFVEAHLLAGRLDTRLGIPRAREKAVERAKEAGATDHPSVLLEHASFLGGSGQPDLRIEVLRGIMDRNHLSIRARNQRLDALLDIGQFEEAQKLFAERSAFYPFDASPLLRKANIALGQDQVKEAIDLFTQALAICPENHSLHERRGSAHWSVGTSEAAFRDWERSLALQPNQPKLRERIEFLRKSPSRFEDSVRFDVASLIQGAIKDPPKNEAGEEARVLFDQRAVEVYKDGTTREYVQYVVQILSELGIRSFDRYSTYFASGEQMLEYRRARVYRGDGTTADARLSRFGGSGGGNGSFRRAAVDLPALSVGDVVEIEFVREELSQSFFGDYFGRRELFRGGLTTDEKRFVLRVPKGRTFYFHQRHLDEKPAKVIDEDAGKITYTWKLRGIPRIDPEPAMPAVKEFSPRLEVSTFESWASFSTWYHNLIRKQFESSPEIAAKVRELVSGKSSEIEKIRAIYNFVITDIRYNAWEFGVHGFKPYNASTVFSRRFGDCKDKSTLLTVMLKEVGIKSQPVLIFADSSRGEEDLTLPMVNHFNHCITHVPAGKDRPRLFLDGTASFHRLEDLPSMDRGARVLVVEDKEAGLTTIPWNEPGDLSIDEDWTVDVSLKSASKVHMRLQAQGDFAVNLRRVFEVAGQRRTNLESIWGRRFAGARVTSEMFSDLTNIDEPVAMTVNVEAPQMVLDSSDGPGIVLPEDFFGTGASLQNFVGQDDRSFDVILSNPRSSKLRVEYRLPEGLKVKSLPEEREIAHPFGRLLLKF